MENEKNAFLLMHEYSKKIDMDTQIDATNIFEKQLLAPNLKHQWLYKLVQCKRTLIELIEKRDDIINGLVNNNPMGINSKASVKFNAERSPDVIKLNKKIREQELLVDYLDGAVNKIFSQMGFDFKNLVELLKLEQI